ncbi:hypothetical protein [Streptacidiphilus sp. PAMC 29251]
MTTLPPPPHQHLEQPSQPAAAPLCGTEPPTVAVPRPVRAHAQHIAEARQARYTTAPVNSPTRHEQAESELRTLVAVLMDAPEASAGLHALVNERQVQPEGAEIFAALLYLTGRTDAAEFWWRFAGGSGSSTAAYCLHLYHLSQGEPSDAEYWYGWYKHLTTNQPPRARVLTATRPLLPADVRRDIMIRSKLGLDLRLPAAIETVINQLPVTDDDPDFGEVPQPTGFTAHDLQLLTTG